MILTKPLSLVFLHRSDFVYLTLSGLLFTFLFLLSTDTNAANSTETEIENSLRILLPLRHLEASQVAGYYTLFRKIWCLRHLGEKFPMYICESHTQASQSPKIQDELPKCISCFPPFTLGDKLSHLL